MWQASRGRIHLRNIWSDGMHAVPFIPTISFKLAECERFYVDTPTGSHVLRAAPFLLLPRVIIQIRKLLVVPPSCCRSCVRFYKSTLFPRVCPIEIKKKKKERKKKRRDTINRMRYASNARGAFVSFHSATFTVHFSFIVSVSPSVLIFRTSGF